VSRFADLHIHSYFSDGSYSPQDILVHAQNNGLAAVALTDHDTVEGVPPLQALSAEYGIEVIPGIEFSTEFAGRDIHILGYFLDINNAELQERIIKFQQARKERVEKMVEKLLEMGVNNITAADACALTKSGSVGRPHLAILLKQRGWVKDNEEAFAKYLAEDAPAYVAKFKQTPVEAIDLIRRAGGVAVYAHPMVTGRDEIIPKLVEAGLGGIEVCYPNCSPTVEEFYKRLAQKYNLAMTGGSDAHGESRNYIYVGKARIPYEWVEDLRKRAKP